MYVATVLLGNWNYLLGYGLAGYFWQLCVGCLLENVYLIGMEFKSTDSQSLPDIHVYLCTLYVHSSTILTHVHV